MLQSKLLTLLRAFSKEELKRFDAFIASPYFNQSEKLVKFYRLIQPHQPRFDSDKLQKEVLYKALHGKGKYSDATMRELISELFKLAKAFIAQEEMQADGLETCALRYRWLYKRNVEKLPVTELEGWGLKLDNYPVHDFNYYQHRWLNDKSRFLMRSDAMIDTAHKMLKSFDVLDHVHSLNRNYLINCFSAYNYLLAFTKVNEYFVNETALTQIEALATDYINKGDIVIDILFYAFQLARTNNEMYYYHLKSRVFENNSKVPESILTEATVALKNYGGQQLSDGIEKFRVEMLNIYRFEVDNNYFLCKGKMSYNFYFNIAAVVSESSELDWADNFVENYKHYLPVEFGEDAYYYAKAHILFARRLFEPALRMAVSCKIPFPVAKILIRNLVARIQYELGMLEEMYTELETHRHHLKDENLGEDYRLKLYTFTTVLRQLGEL